MSTPPPNPDNRPLPPGWIQQYNWDYKQWFYVNEREQPPRSSWEHPMNQSQYTPPPGAPPANRNYNSSSYGAGYNQGPPSGGYAPSYDRQGGYGGGNAPYGGYGGAPGGGYQSYPPEESRGFFGRPSQPQQPVYAQQPKRSGPGIGTAVLAGGAGLVGGALLMDAFEDHEEHEEEQAYDQGYGQGYDQGNDNGGDW